MRHGSSREDGDIFASVRLRRDWHGCVLNEVLPNCWHKIKTSTESILSCLYLTHFVLAVAQVSPRHFFSTRDVHSMSVEARSVGVAESEPRFVVQTNVAVLVILCNCKLF